MHPSNYERGMSLIEMMVAMAILAIVLTGAISTFLMTAQTNDRSHERTLVLDGLRSKGEEIQARLASGADDLDDVIDWCIANSAFSIPEDSSSVDEVQVRAEIIVYLDETSIPLELGGDAASAVQTLLGAFGPRSLDGDAVTTTDYSTPDADGTYGVSVAPIELRARWGGGNQDQYMIRRFMLLARDY